MSRMRSRSELQVKSLLLYNFCFTHISKTSEKNFMKFYTNVKEKEKMLGI